MDDTSANALLMAAELGGYPELDLHEAGSVNLGLEELDCFLNRQFVAGEFAVKIIHGRGSGVMRLAVHAHLKTVPFVEAFRDSLYPGEYLGSTVVAFSDGVK